MNWLRQIGRDLARLLALAQRLEKLIMATQADIDALTGRVNAVNDAVTTGVAGIRSDLEDLKTANPGVDTSALDASVTALESNVGGLTELDSENPAAPVDGGTPTV